MEGFGVRLERVELQPADTLVLYTDGLTEATNPGGEQMGLDRLADVIRANHTLSPEQLIQKILEALNNFTGGGQLSDDVTLVACKVA
jgi:sigma-B regulation protein RsbU (phosphoserine phosphatase)